MLSYEQQNQQPSNQQAPKHIELAMSAAKEVSTLSIIEQVEFIQKLKSELIERRRLLREENYIEIERLQKVNAIIDEGNTIILLESPFK